MGFFTFMPQWKGDYTKCKDITTLQPADQIAIWDVGKYFRYQHHGLIWKAGTTPETILVCHIWSPYEDRVESQADSHFRISTLKDFLYKRPLSGMRVVEYYTSSSRRCLGDLGEVHPYPNDCPEIVLARSKFLMGLGKGEFDIFKQNCEHAAHWCQTGIQYCSQGMTMAPGSIPFQKDMSVNQEQALHVQIAAIKDCVGLEMRRILALDNQLVYIRVKGTDDQYVKVDKNDNQLIQVGEGLGTPFRIHCTLERYDRVQIRFDDADSNEYSLRSHGHWTGSRKVQRKPNKRRVYQAIWWEFRSTGHVVSERQHRRYWSIGKNNILEEASMRGMATKFVLVSKDDTSVVVPDLPEIGDPDTTLQRATSGSQHVLPLPKIQEEGEVSGEMVPEQPTTK